MRRGRHDESAQAAGARRAAAPAAPAPLLNTVYIYLFKCTIAIYYKVGTLLPLVRLYFFNLT